MRSKVRSTGVWSSGTRLLGIKYAFLHIAVSLNLVALPYSCTFG